MLPRKVTTNNASQISVASNQVSCCRVSLKRSSISAVPPTVRGSAFRRFRSLPEGRLRLFHDGRARDEADQASIAWARASASDGRRRRLYLLALARSDIIHGDATP